MPAAPRPRLAKDSAAVAVAATHGRSRNIGIGVIAGVVVALIVYLGAGDVAESSKPAPAAADRPFSPQAPRLSPPPRRVLDAIPPRERDATRDMHALQPPPYPAPFFEAPPSRDAATPPGSLPPDAMPPPMPPASPSDAKNELAQQPPPSGERPVCPPKAKPKHPMAYRSWKQAEEGKLESQVSVPIARNAIVRLAAVAKTTLIGFVSSGSGKVTRMTSGDKDPPTSALMTSFFNASAALPTGTILITVPEGSPLPWCANSDATQELRAVRAELATTATRLFAVGRQSACDEGRAKAAQAASRAPVASAGPTAGNATGGSARVLGAASAADRAAAGGGAVGDVPPAEAETEIYIDGGLKDEDVACVIVASVAATLDDEALERASKQKCEALTASASGAKIRNKITAFEKRRAAHSVHQQLPAIGIARNMSVLGISAAVFTNTGKHDVRVITSFDGGNQRFGFSGVTKIYEAVAALPTGTMVVLFLENESPFCPYKKEWRETMEVLVRTYPNMWLLTMNPCIVNQSTGAIGEREIPIPPFDVFNGEAYLNQFRRESRTPVAKKVQQVRWRGASTGLPWLGSPRHRALQQFKKTKELWGNESSKFIDVGISHLVQRVTRGEVPIYEGEMSEEAMCKSQLQLDLDGDVNSWRGGQWKLFVGAAVLRADSRYVQWYYRHMVNGTHLLWYETPEELADAAVRLVRSPQTPDTLALLERLSRGAREIGERFHTLDALEAYTEERVRCAASEYDPTMDWRMRRAPASQVPGGDATTTTAAGDATAVVPSSTP